MPLLRISALLVGLLALAVGLVLKPFDWIALAPRALDALLLAFASAVLGAVAARLLRLPLRTATLLVGLGVPGLVYAGPAAILATGLVLAGGLALGSFFRNDETADDPLIRLVAGLGLLAAAVGWLLPVPMHHAPVWACLLLALVWWRRAPMRADLERLRTDAATAVADAPRAAYLCTLVVIVAAAPAWLPTVTQDDLAYHLALPWQLLTDGHAHFDIGNQIWAMAPWSGDTLQALAMVLAGVDARGPIDLAWFLAAVLLVRRLGQSLGLTGTQAWLAAMLYASLPFSSSQLMSMQVEGVTPAILAALALLILQSTQAGTRPLGLVAVLAGFLVGAKASNFLVLLPFLAWLAWSWRGRLPWASLPRGVALGLLTGGSSYALAWGLAGNPVMPLYNAIFASPWFDLRNFHDPMWQKGVHWNLPWRLVFDTTDYASALPGAAGLAVLALAGGLVAALATPRLRAPLLVAVSASLLVFSQMQFFRYIHPLFVLLLPVLVAALVDGRARWREAVLALLVIGQLALIPTGMWILMKGALRQLAVEGPEFVVREYAPERLLNQRFRQIAERGDRLLFADDTYSYPAELPGQGIGTSWHTPRLNAFRARPFDDPALWARLVDAAGATHLVSRKLSSLPGLSAYLREQGAERVGEAGAAEMFRLAPRPAPMAVTMTGDAIQAQLALASTRPLLGEARVEVSCDRPGQPISVGWTLSRPGEDDASQWYWATCGVEGRAELELGFETPGGGGRLEARIAPAQATSGMTLAVREADAVLRPDFLREGTLVNRAWAPVARLWPGDPHPSELYRDP